MPIYTFKCVKCNYEFDKIMPFSDFDKKVKCEKCKHANANKQISKNISGRSGTVEPWEYEETHKVNGGRGPKFVRDSQGNKIKYNASVHRKGRKGSG